MNVLVPIILCAWFPIVLAIFSLMQPRRAIIVTFLTAWLFLPVAGFAWRGLPDYSKETATIYAATCGVILFSAGRIIRFRPSMYDIPMIVWLVCPFVTSIDNGLGAYDGLSEVFRQCIYWGLPYLIGRIYFRNIESLRELAIGFVIAAIVYIPFIVWEMRMSPRLHLQVYGFNPSHLFQKNALNLGVDLWRPKVFMLNALNLALFMASASVCAVWLWWSGAVKRLLGLPSSMIAAGIVIVTLACQVLGGIALTFFGLGALFGTHLTKLRIPLACVIAFAPAYMVVRTSGKWSGATIVEAVSILSERRAQSFEFRLQNEDLLAEKAMERPLWGWGAWGRSRVYSDEGKDMTITDGFWIIALGQHGIVGLSALTMVILLPITILWWRNPPRRWSHPAFAPAAAVGMLTVLYIINQLPNAFNGSIYHIAIGGLLSVAIARARRPAPITQLASPPFSGGFTGARHHQPVR